VLIKPRAVERGLTDPIIQHLKDHGLTVSDRVTLKPTTDQAETHYAEHEGKEFYPGLIQYLTSGPVTALIVEGEDAVDTTRALIGDTHPPDAADGTIRSMYGNDTYEKADAEGRALRNVVHAADSCDSAERELSIWFP
jgi:nucleoside-diphosphate kinase